jgi:microcystin-dependent protein
MGVLDTTYTFTATDVVTSAKLNNVIDQTTFTSNAVATGNTTLAVTASGQLKVNTSGIGANELANDSVTTVKILDGNVTQAKTNNSLVPTGAIMAFGMNSVPTGWLACNGQTTAGYTALAALVGANVPDLRGYFVRGSGTNSDTVASGAFGVKQADELKSHTHLMYVHPATGGGGNTNPARFDSLGLGSFNTQATGGTETRPYNIALLYCIKY